MYTETSSPRVPGDKFLIENGPFTTGHTLCFSFWYHLYGIGMGTLQIKDNNNTLVSYSGNQGNIWQRASVTLGPGSHLVRQRIDRSIDIQYNGLNNDRIR